jgi:hypothetical protein
MFQNQRLPYLFSPFFSELLFFPCILANGPRYTPRSGLTPLPLSKPSLQNLHRHRCAKSQRTLLQSRRCLQVDPPLPLLLQDASAMNLSLAAAALTTEGLQHRENARRQACNTMTALGGVRRLQLWQDTFATSTI